jgi:uncharacterized cupredoxin-like copper-binding protein
MLSACGAAGNKQARTAATTGASTQGLTGAAQHFSDAQVALARGNLTGPEGVKDHLDEAVSASTNLPAAQKHAQAALAALAKDDRAKVAREISAGLAASRQARVAAAKTTVNVSLGEFFIKPQSSSAAAGPVEFKLTNGGKLGHEFVVIRTNLAPDKLPTTSDGRADEEKAGSVPGEAEELAPGKTQSLRLTLNPGRYVFICNLPGHYTSGQRTGFTVR